MGGGCWPTTRASTQTSVPNNSMQQVSIPLRRASNNQSFANSAKGTTHERCQQRSEQPGKKHEKTTQTFPKTKPKRTTSKKTVVCLFHFFRLFPLPPPPEKTNKPKKHPPQAPTADDRRRLTTAGAKVGPAESTKKAMAGGSSGLRDGWGVRAY